MAEEFIDLYEVLELPIDTDRNTLRKRVNEMYLDAQRNLDHRNFQTRVKYQELFEITLPQARYILLDEGRRDDYDRLVRAYRATKAAAAAGAPVPPPASAEAPAAAPQAAPPSDPNIPGTSPDIGPLPTINVDPAQLAKEREELWSKWKSGLEAVLADKEDAPSPKGRSHSLPPGAGGATAGPAPAPASTGAPAPAAAPATAQPAAKKAPPKKVSFNFDGNEARRPLSSAEQAEEEKERQKKEEMERRRDHHRREIIKETLVNVGLIWSSIGAAAVLIPGFLIVTVVGNYVLFPFGQAARFPALPKPLYWCGALGLIVLGAIFFARFLSKKKRQEVVSGMSRMSYEELLRRTGKG